MSDHSITSLIEKLEGAEGPSIVLDAEICWTLERPRAIQAFWRGAMGKPGPLPDEFSRLPRGLGMASLEVGSPNYTTSLDAALALAERVFPDSSVEIQTGHQYARLRTKDGQYTYNRLSYGYGRAPALALCAAVLRAQSEERA